VVVDQGQNILDVLGFRTDHEFVAAERLEDAVSYLPRVGIRDA